MTLSPGENLIELIRASLPQKRLENKLIQMGLDTKKMFSLDKLREEYVEEIALILQKSESFKRYVTYEGYLDEKVESINYVSEKQWSGTGYCFPWGSYCIRESILEEDVNRRKSMSNKEICELCAKNHEKDFDNWKKETLKEMNRVKLYHQKEIELCKTELKKLINQYL